MLIAIVVACVLAGAAILWWVCRRSTQVSTELTAKVSFTKDTLAALQSMVTIGAILAAGWWFLANRQNRPRVRIEHSVSQRPDRGEPGNVFIGVEVKVTNIGNVHVDLEGGEIEIAEVNPAGKTLEKDPPIRVSLEPGESDQILFRKLLIPSSISTLELRTRLTAPDNYEWVYRSLFDVDEKAPSAKSSSSTPDLSATATNQPSRPTGAK